MRKLIRSTPTPLWIVGLVLFILYFSYSSLFYWNHAYGNSPHEVKIPEKSVSFVTISESPVGLKKQSFKSLRESLVSWRFDEDKEEVSVRFPEMLPGVNTKGVVIYKRGVDAFQTFSEVVNVPVFPYRYDFEGKQLFTFYDVLEDGTARIQYRGKKIELKPNQTYHDLIMDDLQVLRVNITNHGYYKTDQFKTFKQTKK